MSVKLLGMCDKAVEKQCILDQTAPSEQFDQDLHCFAGVIIRVLTRILKIGVPETSFRKSRSPTV